MEDSSSFNVSISFSSSSLRFLDNSSFSFLIASLSISKLIILRVNVSSSVGTEAICIFMVAHASSTKSIALSGKKRSVI